MYQSQKQGNQLTIKFSASFERIDSVCKDVKLFLEAENLHDMVFGVILGIREVLTNAVKHGSMMDPHREVMFFMTINKAQIHVCVSDSGSGFDWRALEKKETPASDTHGRGISILKAYFDRVHYNECGNQIELETKILKQ